MRVVLRKSYPYEYYEDWYKGDDGQYKINTIYENPEGARVLKMHGFNLWFGNHPPPDEVIEILKRDYEPVPVKIVPLQ